MPKLLIAFALSALTTAGFALEPVGQARRSMNEQMIASPRTAGVASKAQIQAAAIKTVGTPEIAQATIKKVDGMVEANLAVTPEEMKPAEKDKREKEKLACVSNNIGVGNTFVWASRYSNVNNYATMVEDVENPENNTCFVRVELKSNDPKINVDDVNVKYHEFGKTITCGQWADYEVLKGRILDAKKSARTWATVGGAVGGAGIGVGAMELFGNKLIGGKVEGQADLKGGQLLYSQLVVLEKDDKASYDAAIAQIKELKGVCDNDKYSSNEEIKPICDEYRTVFGLVK
ncbi:MAG: hypothetical protein IKW57_03840 [Alphaproteobacteria bacterium]|nr:hypothetical protein [Alphaproteobacteria bacterium]